MNATPENERHQLIRSIFQKLDSDEPVEAMNIRDAFPCDLGSALLLGRVSRIGCIPIRGQ